jgi:hypothetical protein
MFSISKVLNFLVPFQVFQYCTAGKRELRVFEAGERKC